MKIVKSGILFKLFEWGGGWPERRKAYDLCSYMRCVAIGVLKALLVAAVVIFFVIPVLLEPIITLAIWVYTGDVVYVIGGLLHDDDLDKVNNFFIIGAILYSFLAFVFLSAAWLKYVVDPYRARQKLKQGQKGQNQEELGVISMWLKGMKEKVCYTIEFVENEKEKS